MALWLRARLLIRPSKERPARILRLWGILFRKYLRVASRPSFLVLLNHLERQTILLFEMRQQLLLLVIFVDTSSVTASRAIVCCVFIESTLLDVQVRSLT